MKKLLILSAVFGLSSLVQAITINAPTSLVGANKLDGAKSYSWGLSLNIGGDQQIASAQIDWKNVTLTSGNSSGTGRLYTDLLSSSKTGVTTFHDGDAAGDYFRTAGSGFSSSTMLGIGNRFFSSVGVTRSMSYILTATQLTVLNAFLNNNNNTFDIGIDPDCHFSVGGLSFTYTLSTPPPQSGQPVPDAATTGLLILASLSAMEIFRRKFASAH